MVTNWLPDLRGHEGPKFRALATALREDARRGVLPPGTRLPPVRDLAWRLKVTPGTVARAYQVAAQEGVIESHVGRGSFIAASRPRLGPLQPMITAEREASGETGPVDLRTPQMPDVGQVEAIRDAMVRTAARLGPEVLDYPSLTRDRPCREALLGWFAAPGIARDLGPVTADDITLTHGGQNAMGLVMQICLTGERPRILAEALAYPGLRHAARLNRAEIVPVAMDDQGMIPESLDRAARMTGARLICISPTTQNPTVARMGLARRAQIVEIARRHDLQIMEDDCFAGLYSTGPEGAPVPSLRALAPERGWHISSLSKTLSAGLRFGWIVCPAGMGDAGRLAAQHSYFGLSLPVSGTVTELLTSGEALRLCRESQRIIDDRVALAVSVLGKSQDAQAAGAGAPAQAVQNGWDGWRLLWQPGVPFLWLQLPTGWRGSTFAQRAAAQGVVIRSADEFVTMGPLGATVGGGTAGGTTVSGTAGSGAAGSGAAGGASGATAGGSGPQGLPNAVRIALACGIPRDRLEAALIRLARLLEDPPGDLPV